MSEELGIAVFPPSRGGGLSISVFAIADAGDFDEVIAEVAGENAVVLGCEVCRGAARRIGGA